MNCILLDGMTLYIFIVLLVYLIATSLLFGLSYFSLLQKKDELKDRLYQERVKNMSLRKENFRFKLKYGELDVGDSANQK